MKRICLFLIFASFFTAALFAQRQMTVAQLTGFIKTSVDAKLADKDIAAELKKIQLTEKLEPNAVSQLMSLGAGPRTSAALRELATASESLPPPGASPTAAGAPAATPAARFTMSPPKPAVMLTVPDSVEQEKILDAIRDYALNYSQNLPNFICTQVTRRQEDPTGSGDHYRSVDKIQELLTYYEHHENYKIMAVDGKLVDNKDRKSLGGATSEGEFGSMMYEIFDPVTATEFEWTKFGKLDGVIMNVFSYRIPQERSHYSILYRDTDRIISGYHGVVYARKNDNAIIRITLECDTIPASFPVQAVKEDLYYGTVKISGLEFVVPIKWESHSRDSHILSFNSAEFALYRKYETGSSITFSSDDTDDKKPDPKDQKPKKP
jgi:hypothetical protein